MKKIQSVQATNLTENKTWI